MNNLLDQHNWQQVQATSDFSDFRCDRCGLGRTEWWVGPETFTFEDSDIPSAAAARIVCQIEQGN